MSSLLKKIRFKLLYYRYKNKPRYTPASIRYRDYVFETPDSISVLWQIKEIFFDEIYFFVPHGADIVIYDCGANIGAASIYLKRLYPAAKIHAFEADPGVAHYLKKNISKNNLKDIEVIEKAVWVNNGKINFTREGADAGTIAENENGVSVECTRLKDHIVKESRIDLLKMDIEGAELEVMRDCKDVLHKVDHLFVEYHSDKHKPQLLPELLEILSKAGFRYYIDGINKKQKPFAVKPLQGNFDLQLNIFAINMAGISDA